MSFSRQIRTGTRLVLGRPVLVARRAVLRFLGVKFGAGLHLEGSVGVGAGERVQLGVKVRLGKDVYLGAWPAGALIIGDHSYVGRGSIILAHACVKIGNDCLIAPGCHITDVNHGIESEELIRHQALVSKPLTIGNDVWVGAGTSILPGVTIGDGAVVGARAVVTKDVPERAIVVGSPAKVLRYRGTAREAGSIEEHPSE